MQYINLTPHKLDIVCDVEGFEHIHVVQPSGFVARVEQKLTQEHDDNGVIWYRPEYGDVIGLEEPRDGVVYIVSGMVLAAISGRDDVLAPGELVRDEAGRVIGCRGLKLPPR